MPPHRKNRSRKSRKSSGRGRSAKDASPSKDSSPSRNVSGKPTSPKRTPQQKDHDPQEDIQPPQQGGESETQTVPRPAGRSLGASVDPPPEDFGQLYENHVANMGAAGENITLFDALMRVVLPVAKTLNALEEMVELLKQKEAEDMKSEEADESEKES